MRTVAEHEVEKDDRHLGVPRLPLHAFVAQALIDHGMRAAAGKRVVAEVDERVPGAAPGVVEGCSGPVMGETYPFGWRRTTRPVRVSRWTMRWQERSTAGSPS